MRKRSGALHSQTQEEYIHLAELAQSNPGIFYNDIPLPTKAYSSKNLQPKRLETKSLTFANFNYDQEIKEKQEYQKQINSPNIETVGSITVIICKNLKQIKNIFMSLNSGIDTPFTQQNIQKNWGKGTQQDKFLELDIRKIVAQSKIYKYWILSKKFFNTQMALSYLNKANFIFYINTDRQSGPTLQLDKVKSLVKINYLVQETTALNLVKSLIKIVQE